MSNDAAVARTTDARTTDVRALPGSTRAREHLSKQASLRDVMAKFATGVTVITAGGRDGHGMTANAFSSVSLDPPLVLCCVARAARMHDVITSASSFAASILRAEQEGVARHFADWRRPRGRAQFDAVEWHRGYRTGSPLISGALAWLECELAGVYDGGDHSIFLGEVISCRYDSGSDALLFVDGRLRGTSSTAA